jgi:hypothetical protein
MTFRTLTQTVLLAALAVSTTSCAALKKKKKTGGIGNDADFVQGTPIDGGGAGGDSSSSGNGGSGFVAIRYADTFNLASSTTGSPTITTSGGYRIYQWTSSGSITF